MPTVMPSARSAETTSAASARTVSVMCSRSRSVPSMRTTQLACASRTTSTTLPCTVARTPTPGIDSKVVLSASEMPCVAACVRMARPIGCSLPCSAAAASASASCSVPGCSDSTRSTRGCPSVSVPVLSNHTWRMRPARSSAPASFTRMPRRLASPAPAMIAMGVASPSAHGQLMMSTVVAASTPVDHWPATPQPITVTSAISSTTGTNTPATRSAIA